MKIHNYDWSTKLIGKRVSVSLVQQGVWEMPLESMPLASGYLKAVAMADERLADHVDVTIHNFKGGDNLMGMAGKLFGSGVPDVLAFSVLGWNFREFGALAETFKQLNPDGWVIFGGTHVANQAERTFRIHDDVGIVVNGEGELVFGDILHEYVQGSDELDLEGIKGISYRNRKSEVVTTPERDRIQDLDVIPSPFLTGAIPLTDDQGKFRYDVALMETNRGCPYKCSFCYWGGAVGQRVQSFSRERLRAELELFAQHKVHTIVLCDANFGMLRADEEFIDDVIELRAQYGYPRAVEASWAKNKSKTFYNIVRKMKKHDMRSSFTLALQTLDNNALDSMNRRNMKVNDWEDLAAWLNREGLDCYAELIWGAPGETVQSFMEGYDKLSRHVSRIAVYPLHLLPNTEYSDNKSKYGLVSVRGSDDDFEHILSHDSMTYEENQTAKRFLFWSRVMAENAVLRNTWVAARELTSVTQSQILVNLDEWVSAAEGKPAELLRDFVTEAENGDTAYGDAVKFLLGDGSAKEFLENWWHESVLPLFPSEEQDLLYEVFKYDMYTLPYFRESVFSAETWTPEAEELHGDSFYKRCGVTLQYDIPRIIRDLRKGEVDSSLLDSEKHTVDFYYRMGAEAFVGSTNHEGIVHFMGQTRQEVDEAAELRKTRPVPTEDPLGGAQGLALTLTAVSKDRS
ncbi:KedN5 family methylcobalamin-dependent radical SAM C-methyltransferase [Streptomyces flavofungini]|uniref:KedN5 family methylcobalamin-dependent radical SAM C-methyltransferase n=1 Tax=Streptomyces flavofungini TaxID=68200 RepID=A0ABS0X7M7_9ACTN|nr:KedN5 family methylcobalamin-dependent radical SAM C-methyltransferase [Streptomyces flavofungini]MBJ3809210.1 KedN5 family methylcobalamin-dependent radical SAM C-methyltransferase [Streptomyces flavofungini]